MYRTLKKHKIEIETLTLIIHYVIGILNKYKSKENREVDLKTITNRPTGRKFIIAKELLTEIKADTLVNKDVELDKHINNLYIYLKETLENKFELNNHKGKSLLENLRKMKEKPIVNKNTSNKPKLGTVKFFNDSKGFGFITEEGTNKDHFVHISGLIDEIKEGDEVEFDVLKGNVRIRK